MSKPWQPYAQHILDSIARIQRIQARGDLIDFTGSENPRVGSSILSLATIITKAYTTCASHK
ncbi:hypothetical protein N9H39_01430 [Gammaproteobacteria bacterium]|nr:hypothetical protein [Gammaproteobacteria bacterium]